MISIHSKLAEETRVRNIQITNIGDMCINGDKIILIMNNRTMKY
jgi:hypothetical protein